MGIIAENNASLNPWDAGYIVPITPDVGPGTDTAWASNSVQPDTGPAAPDLPISYGEIAPVSLADWVNHYQTSAFKEPPGPVDFNMVETKVSTDKSLGDWILGKGDDIAQSLQNLVEGAAGVPAAAARGAGEVMKTVTAPIKDAASSIGDALKDAKDAAADYLKRMQETFGKLGTILLVGGIILAALFIIYGLPALGNASPKVLPSLRDVKVGL